MWFPRPQQPNSIMLIEPKQGQFDEQELYRLFHDENAEEWRHKVGVHSTAEGSAKASTRLLFSQGFVFKTDLAQRADQPNGLRETLKKRAALLAQSGLWHPNKIWFLMAWEDGWLPVSICPALKNFRTATSLDQKRAAWSTMLVFSCEYSKTYDIGLDINPANFGWDPRDDRVYYIDDELYPATSPADVGNVLAARIPEELDAPISFWEDWGRLLRSRLQPLYSDPIIDREITSSIRQYGLPSGLRDRVDALIHGLKAGQQPLFHPGGTPSLQRTAIIADVHSNIQALEAVIARAEDMAVDSWIFLGDAVGYGPNPSECIARLAELPHALFIKGNHDAAVASGLPDPGANRMAQETQAWTIDRLHQAELDWLDAMRDDYRESNWMAVHGSPIDPFHYFAYIYELTYADNLAYLEERDIGLCFYGHTHVPFVHRKRSGSGVSKYRGQNLDLSGEQTYSLINPGAVGQPRDRDPRASFAVWERQSNFLSFHRVDYPVQAVIATLRKEGFAEDLHYRLEEGI